MLGTLGIQSGQAQVFTPIRSSAATEAASTRIDPSSCPPAEATTRENACGGDAKGYILTLWGFEKGQSPRDGCKPVVPSPHRPAVRRSAARSPPPAGEQASEGGGRGDPDSHEKGCPAAAGR